MTMKTRAKESALTDKGNVTFAPGTKEGGNGPIKKPKRVVKKTSAGKNKEQKELCDKENPENESFPVSGTAGESESKITMDQKMPHSHGADIAEEVKPPTEQEKDDAQKQHTREKAMLKLAAQIEVQKAQRNTNDSHLKEIQGNIDSMKVTLESIKSDCERYGSDIETLKRDHDVSNETYNNQLKNLRNAFEERMKQLEEEKKDIEDKYQVLFTNVYETSSIGESVRENLNLSSGKADDSPESLSRVEKESPGDVSDNVSRNEESSSSTPVLNLTPRFSRHSTRFAGSKNKRMNNPNLSRDEKIWYETLADLQ